MRRSFLAFALFMMIVPGVSMGQDTTTKSPMQIVSTLSEIDIRELIATTNKKKPMERGSPHFMSTKENQSSSPSTNTPMRPVAPSPASA